ncbi:class I SAM-dependent methyltransferase [Kitasatospora sp. NPDC052896]|uniref:class I SAM-dependent methyltransferase n=1 Tax=Kitasatospora sp. NPDC052896 TaxID=3364061 RepID=UPI0037C5A998
MTDVQRQDGSFSHQAHADSFGAVAAEYDRARPSYPPELFDEIERLTGRPLEGADLLDVGAGTGIATRLFQQRGARVVAVEPSAGMAAQLHRVSPEIPLVKGDGNALPCHDGTADLIAYAQAFHWTDPDRSLPEALRVLRPGGALLLIWNVKDRTGGWLREQEERLAAALPSYHYYGALNSVTDALAHHPFEVRTAQLPWERRVGVDDLITDLRSKSYFAVLTPEQREPVLAAERAALLAEFPGGLVTEPYTVDLTVAVKRG